MGSQPPEPHAPGRRRADVLATSRHDLVSGRLSQAHIPDI
jgi:hypothetical protein